MMKSFLCIPFFALNAICMLQAQAATCGPEKLQEILQPASKKNPSVQMDCSITLPSNAMISKQLLYAGQQASNTSLDCNGATLQPTKAKLSILITSLLKDNAWDVPQNIQIKNCTLNGSLRIHGMAQNGEGQYLRASSIREGHTQRAQQAAPHNIILDNLRISSIRNMMYFAPGVHDVTLKNSRFDGETRGIALYLDAESANNIIEKNTFNVQTEKRELIAVDGSAGNIIRANTFIQPRNGAINLYRNCGEGGTIRHQTPSNNQIISNRFEMGGASKAPMIWLASRNGKRGYCSIDSGYAFGSSISDNDFAQNNTVADNTFVEKNQKKSFLRMMTKSSSSSSADDLNNLVRVDAEPNQVMRNKVTD